MYSEETQKYFVKVRSQRDKWEVENTIKCLSHADEIKSKIRDIRALIKAYPHDELRVMTRQELRPLLALLDLNYLEQGFRQEFGESFIKCGQRLQGVANE